MASGIIQKTVEGWGDVEQTFSLPFPLTPTKDGYVVIVITASNSANSTYLYVQDSYYDPNLIWYRIYFPPGTINMTAQFPVKKGHTYINQTSANIGNVYYRFMPLE